MRKLNLLAAIAALSLAGGAAVASDAEQKPAKPPKEKRICKGDAGSTSRIAKTKICRTKAEWQAMANQEDLDDAEGRLRGMTRGN